MSDKTAALFFDFDGTLLDSEPLHYKAWVDAIKELGIGLPGFSFIDFVGASDFQIATLLKNDRNTALPHEELCATKDKHFDKLSRAPNSQESLLVKQCVSQLSRNFLLAVVTSSPKGYVAAQLKRMEIDHLFSFIVDCDDVGEHKPHPEPYLKALKESRLTPDKCLCVEDSLAGIQSGSAAGLGVVWLNRYGLKSPEGTILSECTNWQELAATDFVQLLERKAVAR